MTVSNTSVNSPHFWDNLYRSNQSGWDLGGPTPVFVRLAEERHLDPGKMLVLGAGRGHDARLFVKHGFTVTTVDFSVEAIEVMNRLNEPEFAIEVVQADLFSLPLSWNNRFDYILDYTSFCAVLPGRRSEYAGLVTRLLKPGGKYIILAFPIGTRSGGPPFVVQPKAIVDLYAERGFTLQYREIPSDSVPNRKGYEELLILEKV